MELADWAKNILTADKLEDKLFCPDILTDNNPGPVFTVSEPSRPIGMGFTKRSKEDKIPAFQDHKSQDNRAICLHRFAGHELLAVEIMAYAITAFPDASPSFRKGIAHTLKEEQEHVRLYQKRLKEMGLEFGSLPLFKHFWNQVPYLLSPVHYVSVMSLTFEMANLDFAPMYGKSFKHFGDFESGKLMDRILQDEIRHVSFGWKWLNNFRGSENSWDLWTRSQGPKLTPKRAQGFVFHEEHRREAGISEEWIEKFNSLKRKR